MGQWSLVLPETSDVTNIWTNPSFELTTTGWTAGAGTLARVASQQRRGAWCGSYTPSSGTTDGLYAGTFALTNGVTYTASIDVKGVNGVPYQIYFASTVPAVLGTPATFTGTGEWQRVTVTWAENSGASRRFYIVKNNSASTGAYYVDGLLIWAGSYDLLYFDGDSKGFADGQFYWTGTPHASTSVMAAGTRAGGRVVDMGTQFNFFARQWLGFGLAGLSVVGASTPLIGGGVYQRTIVEPRSVALVGTLMGTSQQTMQTYRQALINAVRPDATATPQPVILRYQAIAGGTTYGDPLDIPAVYSGGLEGTETRGFTEELALKFQLYMPYTASEDGNEGASLTYQTSLASVNYIVQRDSIGAWSLMGTGATAGTVYALAVGLDGTLYAGGNFTGVSGVANTAAIAKWNGSAWSALGTGAAGASGATVNALAVGPDGALYAAGYFSSMGGVANTAEIAKWNGSAWSALGTGGTYSAGQEVYSLVAGLDGSIYAGGPFTSMGGVGSTAHIAKWNGSAWSALGSGAASNAVRALVVGPDGTLYAGGDFSGMGGVGSTAHIAKWNGSAWSALGSGGSGNGVYALAVGNDGVIYAGGYSETFGGSVANNIARWNGSAWTGVGSGASGGTTVTKLFNLSDGRIYAAGDFVSMGGIANTGYNAIWNGSSWTPTNYSLPGFYIRSFAYNRSGQNYFGLATSGTATLESVTTATNNGTQAAYPIVRMTGPGTIYSLWNYTTGEAIYFNLTLNSGEVAYLDLTPGAIRFYSNFRSNLLSTILPGSSLAAFGLMPGANSISTFIGGTTDANTAAWMYWRKAHWSIDGGS